ncbi:MAG: hypothetical protein GX660_06760 [Clostridiaceae bacterium]|nr:hypothetical protein [Clostridiaceae bacterium]
MNKYAQVAVNAGFYVKEGMTPDYAWKKASCEIFEPGSSSQKKGCPKNTFLGLYGGQGINAEYARKALNYLRSNNISEIEPEELWIIINEGTKKAYNQQMHVVIAMYKAGLI